MNKTKFNKKLFNKKLLVIEKWFSSVYSKSKNRLCKAILTVKSWLSFVCSNLPLAIKRIYRNCEGFIFPFFGGVIISLLFQFIYLWNANADSFLLRVLSTFIVVLFIVVCVVYQIKKSNLREDIAKALEKMLIKHRNPDIYLQGENIENKDFYLTVWYTSNASIIKLLDKYISYKKINYIFSENEKIDIRKQTTKLLISSINKKLELPEEVRKKIKEQIDLDVSSVTFFNKHEGGRAFFIIKEGSLNNPKNLYSFEIDIEEKHSPFVVFEKLNPKKSEKTFYDINSQHITYVEYMKSDKVKLTIAQPNSITKKITISLSEWLASRNDLG